MCPVAPTEGQLPVSNHRKFEEMEPRIALGKNAVAGEDAAKGETNILDLGHSGPKARFIMLAGNVNPLTRKQLLLKRVLTRRKVERAGPEPMGRMVPPHVVAPSLHVETDARRRIALRCLEGCVTDNAEPHSHDRTAPDWTTACRDVVNAVLAAGIKMPWRIRPRLHTRRIPNPPPPGVDAAQVNSVQDECAEADHNDASIKHSQVRRTPRDPLTRLFVTFRQDMFRLRHALVS